MKKPVIHNIFIVSGFLKKILKILKLGIILNLLSKILIPTRNLSPRNKKIFSLGSLLIIFSLIPVIVFTLTHLRGVEAAWFDPNWSFRKSLAITAHTSAETNVYINLTGGNALDTSDTSRFQADCGDLRFTDARGNILPYYIVSGCGSATTVVHVFFESFPAGAQTIYYYYGNPSAPNGFTSADFSTEASSYTIGSLGSEEAGAAPIAHWKLDEGTGTTALDSSANKTVATLNSFDSNPSTRSGWMKDDQCISGKCLLFNGSSSYVSTADRDAYSPSVNSLSVSFWAKIPTNATASGNGSCGAAGAYMVAKGNTSNWEWGFENDNNTLLCLDLFQTTGSAYKLISVSRTMNDGQWHHYAATIEPGTLVTLYVDGVLVTSANSAFSGSMGNGTQPVEIGRRGDGNYAGEYVDDVKIYGYKRSAAQVKADFDSRGGTAANVFGASDQNKNLTNALVGYWKMDETSWVNDCSSGVVADSSGNGFNGSACPISTGPTGGAAGKFGNAPDLDGSNDYVFVSNFTKSSSKFTISAWVYADSRPTWGSILKNWGNSSRGEFHFGLENTGGDIGLHIMQNDATEISIRESTAIPLGSWQHVVAVADGKYLHLYRNGVEVTTPVAYDGTVRTSFNCLGIGAKPNDACTGSDAGAPGFWDGKIDEARIYNRAFSPREVQQLYNYAPGPVVYYTFEEGSGNSLTDRSGNNNSGTWLGTLGGQWNQGKYGKGGNFNGSNNRVSVTMNSPTVVTGNYSVSAWFYKTSGSFATIVSSRTAGDVVNFLIQSKTSNMEYAVGNGTSMIGDVNGTTNPANNTWHFVSCAVSTTGFNCYLDGKLDATSSWTADTPRFVSSNAFYIGQDNGHAVSEFGGRIDEVKIYNYTRTPSQMISDMNGGHPIVGSPVGSAIGYWKFDEGYGTTANNSGSAGGNIPGTLTNMASSATAVSGWSQSGKYSKALRFDGSNDFVSIANNPQALRFTGDLSISAWINLTDNTAVHDIVSKKGAAGQYGYRLNTTSSGNVQFELSSDGSTVRAATSSSTLSVNKWYHVVGVYSPGNSITVYVDGKQSGQVTTSMPASINNSTANVNIGAENNGASNFFSGAIDEPKIYGGILTAEQVRVEYNRGSSQVMGAMSDTSGLTGGSSASNSASAEYCIPGDTSTCSAPMGRWDFEEGSGSTVNDKSGNGNTGTWQGTLGSQWKQGKTGKGGNFNGSDNYISITPASPTSLTGSYTVSVWVKPNTRSGTIDIFGTRGSGNNSFDFKLQGGTTIHGDIGNGSSWLSTSADATYSYEVGKWYNIVYVVTTTGYTIYVNGRQVGSGSYAADTPLLFDATHNIYIGYYGGCCGAEGQFNGVIDDVRIYGYARTTAQVAYDYNRGAPVGWWKMDECQGSTIHDSSGNNLHGAWSGTGGGTQTASGTCVSGSGAWGNGVTGKFNSSLNFDGTDDYVRVNGLEGSPSEVTVTAWVKMTGGPDTDGSEVVSLGNYVVLRADQTFSPTGVDGIYYDSGSTYRTTSSGVNIVGTGWRHLAYTLTPGAQKIYIDGVLRGSSSYSNAILWTGLGSNTFIGTHGNGDGRVDFTGQIDDVRVYNYPLTKQQIQQVMNQGSAIRFGPNTGAP